MSRNCCSTNNKIKCVLKADICYKGDVIGITISNIKYQKEDFYPLSELDRINFDEIENGMFKSKPSCEKCVLEEKKSSALLEVSEVFNVKPDNFKCDVAHRFISRNWQQTLLGNTLYPFRIITGDCPNWCIHNRSNDSDDYNSDNSCYTQCRTCSDVKKICNSGDVLKVSSELFTIYIFPNQYGNTKQIVPNYLFESTPFLQKAIEKMYLYLICLSGGLPIELIHYICKFLSPRIPLISSENNQLIQLQSLVEDSDNLRLLKSLGIFELLPMYNSVKRFYYS